ncbi:hypothetical protein BH18GEM1_BH18GEM1_20250 [soil metagenome]
MDGEGSKSVGVLQSGSLWEARTRREFLRVTGFGGAVILLPAMFAACGDDDDLLGPDPMRPEGEVVLDLSTDTGVLNFAYALEQLEAAFYTRAAQGFSGSNLSPAEQAVLTDIRNHEVIHRDFLAAVLGGARIPNLVFDFSSLDFADRVSVLGAARVLEDTGVAAYNAAAKLLSDVNNLIVAGKIVSVEARHAAAVRDLLNPGSRDFAGPDVVDPSGLAQAIEPGFVIEGLLQFISTPILVIS